MSPVIHRSFRYDGARWAGALSEATEPKDKAMDIKKTLQNPFVLMAQGFVAGAFLFWSSLPSDVAAPDGAQAVQASAVAESFDA